MNGIRCALIFLLACVGAAMPAQAADAPNIVLIVTSGHNADYLN
jgi:hypothetical protein